MEKIESFKVNHLHLKEGLYLSRRDEKDGVAVTTFDLRFTRPNQTPPMDNAAIHTVFRAYGVPHGVLSGNVRLVAALRRSRIGVRYVPFRVALRRANSRRNGGGMRQLFGAKPVFGKILRTKLPRSAATAQAFCLSAIAAKQLLHKIVNANRFDGSFVLRLISKSIA